MRLYICWLIILYGLWLDAIVTQAQFCTDGDLSPHTGYCYYLYQNGVGEFHTARHACREEYGGDVPTIDGEDEDNFLQSVLGGTNDSYWLGITDLGTKGEYRYLRTNDIMSYNNWNQWPDSTTRCAMIDMSIGKWVGTGCTSSSSTRLVCQVPPDGIDPNTGCPGNFLPYDNGETVECFLFSTIFVKRSAYGASLYCAGLNSQLVVVRDWEVNTLLYSYMITFFVPWAWIGIQETIHSTGSTTSYVPIEFGTEDIASYTNFKNSYSGSDNTTCVLLPYMGSPGKWLHEGCDVSNWYICSYTGAAAATTVTTNPTTSPQPTTPTTTNPPTAHAATNLTQTPNTTTMEATTRPSTTTQTTTESTTPSTTHATTTTQNTNAGASTTSMVTTVNEVTATMLPTTDGHTTTTTTTTTITTTLTVNPPATEGMSSTLEHLTTTATMLPTTDGHTTTTTTTTPTVNSPTTDGISSTLEHLTTTATTTAPTQPTTPGGSSPTTTKAATSTNMEPSTAATTTTVGTTRDVTTPEQTISQSSPITTTTTTATTTTMMTTTTATTNTESSGKSDLYQCQ